MIKENRRNQMILRAAMLLMLAAAMIAAACSTAFAARTYRPAPVQNVRLITSLATDDGIYVRWQRSSSKTVTGYQLKVYEEFGGGRDFAASRLVRGRRASRCEIGGLGEGTYYVRVRAYYLRKGRRVYGKWSKYASGGTVSADEENAEAPRGFTVSTVNSRIVLSAVTDGDTEFQISRDGNAVKDVKSGNGRIVYSGVRGGTYEVRAGCGRSFTETKTVTIPRTGVSSVKNFLRTASSPVGRVMYVLGGGHAANWKMNSGMVDGNRIGLSREWLDYCTLDDPHYIGVKHNGACNGITNGEYTGKGLDCSGYIGWAVYNTTQTKTGQKWRVERSTKVNTALADRGYGTVSTEKDTLKAGDIVWIKGSSSSHVYIVVGTCGDGSVVLMHSSGQGVKLSGTAAPDGNKNSEAVTLSAEYMRQYYPEWYATFGKKAVQAGPRFTEGFQNKFVWSSSTLSDEEGYREMTPDDILGEIYE